MPVVSMNRTILVVEDDPDIARLVQLHLEDLGCRVTLSHDGASGLRESNARRFDLIVLDLNLPDMDGLDVCKRIRSGDDAAYVPLLMLTARSSETDRVVGLELGADDYLTKPFGITELVARVKAIFRRVDSLRATPASEPPVRIGDLVVDPARRSVEIDGRSVDLTAREFDLLAHFARHPGRVFTRDQLLDRVWGYAHGGYAHTVNSHINRLRAKIEPDPASPTYVQTVWGVGYKMRDLPDATGD